jgi:hypothetical protein
MSSALAELSHAAYLMDPYAQAPTAYAENETPATDTRFVQQKSAAPRTSRAPGYSSKTPSLGQRICVWIKDKFTSLNSARLKFNYENACSDALFSLEKALSGDHAGSSKLHLLNLVKCRERQVAYLKLQSKEASQRLDKQYHESLAALCGGNRETLAKLKNAMEKFSQLNLFSNEKTGFHIAFIATGLLQQKSQASPK